MPPRFLIAPLPGNLLSVMAGYVFGFGTGLLLSLLGLMLGACLAVLIARKFGRPLLERFFKPAELVQLGTEIPPPLPAGLVRLVPLPRA